MTRANVTYINHIPRGSGWNTANDLSNILRVWKQDALPKALQETQFVNLAAAYKLDSGNSVRFDVQPGLRMLDNVDVVQLTVTVGGKMVTNSLTAWFDSAQKELVQSFVDFTTDEIQSRVQLRKS